MNRPCESLRPTAQPVPAKPPALSALWVEVASGEAALAFYADALEEEHALGAGHAAGRRLWQIVRRTSDDAPVAVLRWAASAFHLRARDAWIGWDAMTRSRRSIYCMAEKKHCIVCKATISLGLYQGIYTLR